MLPRVRILFDNGTLGATTPSDDAVTGLIASATAVASTFALGTAYLLGKLSDLVALGITADSTGANAAVYKTVQEFYLEAPEGTKLWLYGVADTVTLAQMADKDLAHAPAIINAARREIRTLVLCKTDATGYTPVILDGLDADVYAAATKAQALGEWTADVKYAPIMTIIPGRHYAGTAASLASLHERTDNRVCVMLGDSVSASDNAAVGLLAGRMAAIPVQRSVMRVKSGSLPIDTLYIGDKLPELASPDAIHDKGFVTFRDFEGKTNYFFTDDKMATATSDDYAMIPRRRVIDKAFRIAYRAALEELGDETPVTSAGTMPASTIKNIQRSIEREIENNMTALGNLGNDPADATDTGVKAYIDENQNIVASGILNISLGVKPHGYPKYIDVKLGFLIGQ